MSAEANAPAADLMRRIAETERKGHAETEAYHDLVATLRERMEDMPTAEIAALVQREPDLEEDEGYWCAINALRERVDRETFEICRVWAGSETPVMREAAADVLGQLGAEGEYPFAAETVPLIQRLLQDTDVDVVASALSVANTETGRSPVSRSCGMVLIELAAMSA